MKKKASDVSNQPTTSYIKAAQIILRDSGRPMTAQEITTEAITRGLIVPRGLTPERTMMGMLYTNSGAGDPFKREYTQSNVRAVRNSVRWVLAE